jgi:pectate disaccharide-lyase
MPKRYFTSTLFGVTMLGIVNCGSTASSGGDDATAGTNGTHPSGGSGSPGAGAGAGSTVAGSGGAAPGAAGSGVVGGAGGSVANGTGGSGSATGGAAGTGSGNGGATAGGSGATAGAGGSVGGTAGAAGGTGGPCDIWVAPNGVDTNPGTAAAPVLTPQHAYDLVCPGTAGAANGAICSGTLSTICLKAGTYALSTRIEFKKTRMGTSSRIITMMADPAATTKPIIDFAGQPRLGCEMPPADKNIYGIDMGADWYRLKNLEIANSNDTCVLVQGAHDFVENCAVHGCGDTGVLINSSSGYTGSGSYETILNVDSYQNADPPCNGANADGFGAKKGSGAGNVFDGCRSWDNADDGFDLFAWTDPVTIKNSWAFNQGATYSGSASNGNGFKMGGGDVKAQHIMSNDFGFYNQMMNGTKTDWGFTYNSNPADLTCDKCGAWNNKGGTFQHITVTNQVTASTTPAKAAAAKRNADGSLPDITKL